MQSTVANRTTEKTSLAGWFLANRGLIGLLALLLAFPFLLALAEGQSFGDVLANEAGNAKFMQGLLIEVFILAIYALSYDLILGVTGLLSFGHAMFFATGAYFTGIAFKNLGWGAGQTLLGLIVVAVVQALLFGVVLPRVKGITFALVTLGLASVFHIVVQSTEMSGWTGAICGRRWSLAPCAPGPLAMRVSPGFTMPPATRRGARSSMGHSCSISRNVCIGRRFILASERRRQRRFCGISFRPGVKSPLQPAPYLQPRVVPRALFAIVAPGRAEAPVIAEPQFLQPAAPVDLHPDGSARPARIAAQKFIPQAAHGQPILPAEAIHVRKGQAVPQYAADAQIGFRFADHAAAMLCPLPRDQPGGGGHAQIGAQFCRGWLPRCAAPLRPAAAPLRP